MSDSDIKQKAEEVRMIHREYMEKMAELRKEQSQLLDDFMSKLEDVKKKEIMNKIRA